MADGTLGAEEEIYTGLADGTVVGLSEVLAHRWPDRYHTEPDHRNVEQVSRIHPDPESLLAELQQARARLRADLATLGPYTLIPGSTLALDPPDRFEITDPANPYYVYIRDHYGARVVTTSQHLHLGIDDPWQRMRAWRALRCEAWMFLALSAASPFLAGAATGWHSTRWHLFPGTPERVPFFQDPAHFAAWVEARLSEGVMYNRRHLWLAVRPNGPESPHRLDRIELRICDQSWDLRVLADLAWLLRALVERLLADPDRDPLQRGNDQEAWHQLIAVNQAAVARSSLQAEVIDPWSGIRQPAAELIFRRLAELPLPAPVSNRLHHLVAHGNQAQRWLVRLAQGRTVRQVVVEAMQE